jgi:Na+/melibiose symporter-like transporter
VQQLYANGTQYWFEQSLKTIEGTCAGASGNTTLPLDRYSTSGIGSQQIGFIITAAFFGLYHFIVMQNLVSTTKEREAPKGETLPLVSSIMRSLNNAAFRPLLGAWALDGLMLAALVTMFPFYIRYVIQPEGLEAQDKGQALDAEVGTPLFLSLFSSVVQCTAFNHTHVILHFWWMQGVKCEAWFRIQSPKRFLG